MRSIVIALFSLSLIAVFVTAALSQRMTTLKATVSRITADFPIAELSDPGWRKADEIEIATYWDGTEAPAGRRFKVRMLWSDTALYVRFEAAQAEPLIVSEKPNLSSKTMKLWDRDVCEIFLAPDGRDPKKYLEFEVAPTGEWIDLAIDFTGKTRETDWDFKSGMESAAQIGKGTVLMAIKVPWSAFGKTPKTGDVWLGNLFRCVGKDPTRGYLAWRPTMTEKPNFHVPEKFGEFEFVK